VPWDAYGVAIALGLTGLALSVERRSDDLFVQVFTRLNLTFIFLAGVLMALASQAERSKRMEFAGRQVEELAEFLRGHVMYYLSEGEPAQDILASPVILRQIVSGFGHYADLRMVRVQVLGEELELSIDEGGVVTQRQRTVSENPSDSARASPRVVVAELPIFYEDEPVGRVLLEETRESVNQEMAQSILVIFFAFTSAVTVASLIIGVIVFEASEKLKRQVKQIEQSERGLMQAAKLASIGELVSGVAHELNNPLGVIVSRTGYLRELMRDTLSSPRDMAEDLEAIDRQAHRISRIVRDLLGFARPHPLELGSVDVRDLVDQALHLTGGRVRQASLQVRKDIPADLPRLKADRDRLQQVLVNLINNAVDAMPKGGKLEFTARRQDGQILLSVSDTGVGIAEEDLKRIFDPFFSKKQGKGTGLGLSISYGIVRDHGGRIWAESRSGEGATFFVLLPAEARDE
ncbi:MAG: sensor histidine kinase, partial [Acidobacteriota bacterium]